MPPAVRVPRPHFCGEWLPAWRLRAAAARHAWRAAGAGGQGGAHVWARAGQVQSASGTLVTSDHVFEAVGATLDGLIIRREAGGALAP